MNDSIYTTILPLEQTAREELMRSEKIWIEGRVMYENLRYRSAYSDRHGNSPQNIERMDQISRDQDMDLWLLTINHIDALYEVARNKAKELYRRFENNPFSINAAELAALKKLLEVLLKFRHGVADFKRQFEKVGITQTIPYQIGYGARVSVNELLPPPSIEYSANRLIPEPQVFSARSYIYSAGVSHLAELPDKMLLGPHVPDIFLFGFRPTGTFKRFVSIVIEINGQCHLYKEAKDKQLERHAAELGIFIWPVEASDVSCGTKLEEMFAKMLGLKRSQIKREYHHEINRRHMIEIKLRTIACWLNHGEIDAVLATLSSEGKAPRKPFHSEQGFDAMLKLKDCPKSIKKAIKAADEARRKWHEAEAEMKKIVRKPAKAAKPKINSGKEILIRRGRDGKTTRSDLSPGQDTTPCD